MKGQGSQRLIHGFKPLDERYQEVMGLKRGNCFLEGRKKVICAQTSHSFCVIEMLVTKGLFSRSYSQLVKEHIYNKNISLEFWQYSRILVFLYEKI